MFPAPLCSTVHASAKLLARLAPKISSMSPSSGHGDLQPLDVAAALAGLSAGPYALARVAWVDDRTGWRNLMRLVQCRLGVGGNWDGVIALAVAEFCWPPHCGDCAGRGEINKKEYFGVCQTCRGSGYGRVPIASLADNCGVTGKEWGRIWAGRYERVHRLVSAWGSEALSHLNRRLGPSSKNGEPRLIPILQEMREAVARLPLPCTARYMWGRFKRAARRAGLEDLRFHDLRHTTASLLINAGYSLKVVQEVLGHRSVTAANRYAHLSVETKRAALERVFG